MLEKRKGAQLLQSVLMGLVLLLLPLWSAAHVTTQSYSATGGHNSMLFSVDTKQEKTRQEKEKKQTEPEPDC